MEEKKYKLFPMTFFWMFLGLLGTAIIAIYSYNTNICVNLIKDGYFSFIMVIELAVVIVFSLLFRKLPATIVAILYFVYAMINGISLSVIFYIFELKSIGTIFVSTAVLFGLLGIYGYRTKTDVSRWQPILMWTLIIGLIVSVVNIFIRSSFLDIIVDWGILITMFGVTVYDMNKMKLLAEANDIDNNKVHIYCAMQLYLDFINIFVRLLSLFGKRRR